MSNIINIPELGENIKGGTVVSVLVKPGDTIAAGKGLLELETDKAVLEIPSPSAGTITEVMIKKGDKITIGQPAFKITGESVAPAPAAPPSVAPAAETPAPSTTPQPAPAEQPVPNAAPRPFTFSPAANAAAAPSVRRLAREIGITINDVPGSGQNGRISLEDVKAYAKKLLTGAGPHHATSTSKPLPDFSKWGAVSREAMSTIRQKTAEHMAYSWATVPHVTHFAKADITELDTFRQKASTPALKLTITSFLVKTIAAALKNFPKFNASIDMKTQEIVYKSYYNIGIAVDTEHGLLVPVIKDADKKSIIAIAQEMKTLAEKARTRKLTLDDMQGGTFTITNLGGITGGTFTPIVNAPEVAILGISRAALEPCYNYGPACAPRLMLPLCLSYDHRLIDGADGAKFVQWLTDAVQQPFLLEMN